MSLRATAALIPRLIGSCMYAAIPSDSLMIWADGPTSTTVMFALVGLGRMAMQGCVSLPYLTTGRLASLCHSAYFNIGVGNPVASPFFRLPHTPANHLCTIVYLTLNTTAASHSVILALYVLSLVLINEVRRAAM